MTDRRSAHARPDFKFSSLALPVIQAPMAGSGITTPALVAAACEAGVLGSLAAAYCTCEQLERDVSEVRRRTDRPFAINVFAPTEDPPRPTDAAAEIARLATWHSRLGLPPPVLPETASEPFDAIMELIIALKPAVVSCTFGVLPKDVVERLKQSNVFVVGTATTVGEARTLEACGFDAVVAQGAEAGGHRGGFTGARGPVLVGTMALVPQVVDALTIPVIASGGIMDGRGIAAALALGASAVQLGTAFLTTRESGAPSGYKEAVLAATDESTIITTAFSGRPARGIVNQFIEEAERLKATALPYPWQNALTRPLRKACVAADYPEALSLWAGQGAALARNLTVAELVAAFRHELDSTVKEMATLTATVLSL